MTKYSLANGGFILIVIILFIGFTFTPSINANADKLSVETSQKDNAIPLALVLDRYNICIPDLSEKHTQPYNMIYPKKRDDISIPLQYGDILDQYMIETNNWGWQVSLLQVIAQGFTPNMSILTRVEIELFKHGSPPLDSIIYVGLYDDLYGDELAYVEFTGYDFQDTRQWFTCDFEDIVVEPGHTYYIICFSDWFDFEIAYAWFYDINNPYPRGDAWGSVLFSDWILLDDPPDNPMTDCCFRTYGIDKDAMKWTFLRGSISNMTAISNYTILKAEDIHGLQIFPLNRIHYTNDEKITIYNKFFGIVNNGKVFGLFKAHI